MARSTFRSQNVQNTPAPDHFWQLRCRKSARRCGAKHISKSKCTEHLSVGRLLEVEMSHTVVARSTFGSQNVQNTRCGPLLAVEMSKKCTPVVARSTFGSQNVKSTKALLEVQVSKKCTPLWREAHFEVKNVQNTPAPDHFWQLRCRKSARRCGAKHIWKSKC